MLYFFRYIMGMHPADGLSADRGVRFLLPEGIRPLFDDASPEVDFELLGAGEDGGFDLGMLHPLADLELLS